MAELDNEVGGLGLGAFADMVDAEDVAETLSTIEQEIKESGFGDVDVRDFADFNTVGEFLETGSYGFSVEARHLFQSTNIMKLIGQIGAKADSSIKITIFEDRLKLAAFSKVAFAEDLIKLVAPATNVEKGHEVSFVFDGAVMSNIARNLAAGGIIQFVYNATRRELNIKEGSLDLSLSTKPAVDFAEFHKQIGEPIMVGQFDPLALQQSLLYLELFSQRNDTQRTMGVVNVDGGQPTADFGRVTGGSHEGIAIYDTKGLANIKLRIPNPAMKPIYKIAAKMHPEGSYMFVAGKYILFRDFNLYMGFELTEYEFPKVASALNEPPTDKVSVTREQLVNALIKLSVVNSSLDSTVSLTITGTGQNAGLELRVMDSAGKVSTDRIGALRDINYTGDLSFEVSMKPLGKTLKHFKTENVILTPTARSLMIRDDGENYHAVTILTIMDDDTKKRIADAKQEQKKKEVEAKTGVTDKDLEAVSIDEDDVGDDILSEAELEGA